MTPEGVRYIWCNRCKDFSPHIVQKTKDDISGGVWFRSMCLSHNNISGLSQEQVTLLIIKKKLDLKHSLIRRRDWRALVENKYL